MRRTGPRYLAEDKIEPEVVENMSTWQHSGFSVDQSVLLPAGDQAGSGRLVQDVTRCLFSLARLVKVSDTGQVVYKAEKASCRSFPDPARDGIQAGPKRNYQILLPLDFLAEFTQHIPVKRSHLIRYYGWYSNKSRGRRKEAAVEATGKSSTAERASPGRSSQSWPILIKRVYEVDPLSCQECGSQMRVVAFIEPPQRDVAEEILRHCGLWRLSKARAPPTGSQRDGLASAKDPNSATDEMTFVDMDTFEANF